MRIEPAPIRSPHGRRPILHVQRPRALLAQLHHNRLRPNAFNDLTLGRGVALGPEKKSCGTRESNLRPPAHLLGHLVRSRWTRDTYPQRRCTRAPWASPFHARTFVPACPRRTPRACGSLAERRSSPTQRVEDGFGSSARVAPLPRYATLASPTGCLPTCLGFDSLSHIEISWTRWFCPSGCK